MKNGVTNLQASFELQIPGTFLTVTDCQNNVLLMYLLRISLKQHLVNHNLKLDTIFCPLNASWKYLSSDEVRKL